MRFYFSIVGYKPRVLLRKFFPVFVFFGVLLMLSSSNFSISSITLTYLVILLLIFCRILHCMHTSSFHSTICWRCHPCTSIFGNLVKYWIVLIMYAYVYVFHPFLPFLWWFEMFCFSICIAFPRDFDRRNHCGESTINKEHFRISLQPFKYIQVCLIN